MYERVCMYICIYNEKCYEGRVYDFVEGEIYVGKHFIPWMVKGGGLAYRYHGFSKRKEPILSVGKCTHIFIKLFFFKQQIVIN